MTSLRLLSHALACVLAFPLSISVSAQQGDPKRGEYLMKAGGCLGCHTEEKKDAVPFAGGRALKTPFGTFYGPNLTPHPEAGLGKWTEADFVRAMREGKRPDGANYYPAFPYPSFTKITDADLRDLWAYFRSLPPNATPNKPHELGFPYNLRFTLIGWKMLFFKPGPSTALTGAKPEVVRGEYLVNALGHCGECHTPRNMLGGPKSDRHLAGGKGPEGKNIPNITPTRLGKLSDDDLKEILKTAMTGDGDVLSEAMGEVVRNTTSQLTPEDLNAMVAYLRAVPALPDEPKK